jgi:hypothetical protein
MMSWKASIHKFRVPSAVERVTLKNISLALKVFVRGLLGGNPPPHIFPAFSALVRKVEMSSEDGVELVMLCWLQSAE